MASLIDKALGVIGGATFGGSTKVTTNVNQDVMVGVEVNLDGMREIDVPGYSALAAGFRAAVEDEDAEDQADFGREVA